MQSLRRIAAYLGAFAVLSWVMVALSMAQTADLPPGGSDAGSGLGEPLTRSGGVIRPPAGVDPGLTQPPPNSGSSNMPVLRPPGTPGSDADANPK